MGWTGVVIKVFRSGVDGRFRLRPVLVGGAALVLASDPSISAAAAELVQFNAKTPSAAEVLTITPAQAAPPDILLIHFAHRASESSCSFEVDTQATRLPQKGDPDDYNEAMPDGSYVRFANYKPQTEAVKELSVDVSSKRARFAAITVALPAGYDAKKCRVKGPLEVVFFGK